MAEKVLIIGESGRGKTFSIMNMNPDTTAIVSPEKTRLPFRTKFDMLTGVTDCKKINKWIDEQVKKGKKAIIIDDFQYILAIPYMHRIHETGWDKYNDFGGNYFDILDHSKELPDDVILYFMSHTETLEDGVERVKLIGKLLREKITIEGLFTIVLKAIKSDDKWYFTTQNSGKDTVKTPYGMFDSYAIENDLAYVDAKIRNYYGMSGAKTDEEIKADDEEHSLNEITKPDPKGRRSRTKDKDKEPESTEEPVKRRRGRKAEKHDQAVEEVNKMMDKVSEIADGRDEVPFDEVMEAMEAGEENKPVADHDMYMFHEASDCVYVIKKGEEIPVGTIDFESSNEITKEQYEVYFSKFVAEEPFETFVKTADGNFKKVMSNEVPDDAEIITEEEFNAGVKALAQGQTTRRTRRTRKER